MATKRKTRAATIDVVQVLHDLRIPITKVSGDEITASCPRHYYNPKTNRIKKDRNPSWQINMRSGRHICWSCGYSGGLLGLVCDLVYPNSSRPLWEATEWLSGYGRDIDLSSFEVETREPERVLPPKALLEARWESFRAPSSRALAARKLTREAALLYDIRVDPETNLWVLPVHGPEGDLWGWQYKSKGYFHNVPENMTKSKTLFGLRQFQGGRAVLVEAQLDVVRLASVGIGGGLAAMGVRTTEAQMNLIMEAADELIVAYDNPKVDPAGKAEARRLERLYGARIRMRFFDYGKSRAKDPGEMDDPVAIRQGVEQAKLLGATRWRPPTDTLSVRMETRTRKGSTSRSQKEKSPPKSFYGFGASGTQAR